MKNRVNTYWMMAFAGGMALFVLVFLLKAFFVGKTIEDTVFDPRPFDIQKETSMGIDYQNVAELYKNKAMSAAAIMPNERNLFRRYVKKVIPDKPFAVEKIVYEPFVFMYMGYIEKSEHEVIAQINWDEQTFFVRVGEMIQEWTVVKIERGKVEVMNDQGESIELPLQQKVMSKKPFATIMIYASGLSKKITIGDSVEGHKVLDITRDTVILASDSGPIKINK